MVLSILLIAFLIIIFVIIYDIATTKNCGNCKRKNNCWAKIDAQTYKHSCEHHKKAEETV